MTSGHIKDSNISKCIKSTQVLAHPWSLANSNIADTKAHIIIHLIKPCVLVYLLKSVLYQLATMTQAEILKKKQSHLSIWMSNIADNRPDLSECWTHEKYSTWTEWWLGFTLFKLWRKAGCHPLWISSYPFKIGQFMHKISTIVNIFSNGQ